MFYSLLMSYFKVSDIDSNKYVEDRILSKSADTRLLAVDLFLKYFPQKPMFGSGIHVDDNLRRELAGRSSQIHVGVLSHLYEFGIIGSLLFFLAWFFIAKKFYITAKTTGQYGIFIGFLCFLFANLTLVEYSMFYMGIIFLFIFNRYYSTRYIMDNISSFDIIDLRK